MVLVQIDPLSKPVAISEMLLLLGGSAFIGWLLARWIVSGRINGLKNSIDQRQVELEECRTSHATATRSTTRATPSANFLVAEPIVSTPDNLKLVEGIGPKIEGLLNAEGIYTFARLAATDSEQISKVLKEAGPRFQMHDPGTWPEQAAFARDGEWENLKHLKETLNGGKK